MAGVVSYAHCYSGSTRNTKVKEDKPAENSIDGQVKASNFGNGLLWTVLWFYMKYSGEEIRKEWISEAQLESLCDANQVRPRNSVLNFVKALKE